MISMFDIIEAYGENTSTEPISTQKKSSEGCAGCLAEFMAGLGGIIIVLIIFGITGTAGYTIDPNPLGVALLFGFAVLLILGGCMINQRKS